MDSKAKQIKQYNKERDDVLRKLDIEALNRHMDKWSVPRPKQWIGEAPLIMMHKARLVIDSFSIVEKELSRNWLLERGYDASPFAEGRKH